LRVLQNLNRKVLHEKFSMNTFHNLLSLFILTSSVMYAQTPKDSMPAKVSEQKEIKATNHLRKEMEQKQLTAPPERIEDSNASLKTIDKRKNKKSKPQAVKETNRQSE